MVVSEVQNLTILYQNESKSIGYKDFRAGFYQPKQKAMYLSSLVLYVQGILFEIDCIMFYTNLYKSFCQFMSWTNWVKSGKFMDNCWIWFQVMADMKKVYDGLIIINLESLFTIILAWLFFSVLFELTFRLSYLKYWKIITITLQMFCLLNPQINVCKTNPKTTSRDFNR